MSFKALSIELFLLFSVSVLFLLTHGTILSSVRKLWMNDSVKSEIIGSFLGAFFAVAFALIIGLGSRLLGRIEKHYNCCVHIETHLNRMISSINDLVYQLKSLQTSLNRGDFYINIIPNLLEKNDFEDILDLNLKNRFFSFNLDVIRLNGDIDNLNKRKDFLFEARTSQKLTQEEFVSNCNSLAKDLSGLIAFTDKLKKFAISTLAFVRCCMTNQKLYFSPARIAQGFMSLTQPRFYHVELEIKKVENELETSKAVL